ncbi:MAG: hypothetical protein ACFFDU_01990 [Candidatus Thorarchaeota archaeon]
MARWEFRRAWNYLRKSIRQPTFITLQILSLAIVILVVWFLWSLIFVFPVPLRGALYWLTIDSGLIGSNTIWIVYAVLSLIIAQQIVKAVMDVPLSSNSEQADTDYLLPAPIRGHVFYSAKYIRSIPRRLTIFLYIIVAFQPILWYFGVSFGLTLEMFALFVIVAFLLAEIGSIATQGLYAIRKLVLQPRPKQLLFRFFFYFGLIIGVLLVLSPVWLVYGCLLPSPLYNLAYMLVAIIFSGASLGSEGSFTYLYFPALPWVLFGLVVAYLVILGFTRWLTSKITIDLYEELAAVTRQRGTTLGALSRLPIIFSAVTTPLRALFKKDFVTGIRKPGKIFYLIGLIANFVFAFIFLLIFPLLGSPVPIPLDLVPAIETLYTILLVVIIPLLAISSADPFQGEYGSIYLIRLSPVAPLKLTFIKYSQFLVTPICLAIPFAIYFATLLGNLYLLAIAFAILPHAVLIATAIGVGLGSRYPYSSRTKNETPVALMITFPVISWVAIIPVLIFQLGFLPGGVVLMLLSSILIAPYTICLVLILLSWSSHSYLRQES